MSKATEYHWVDEPKMPPKDTEMTFATYEDAAHLAAIDPKRYKVIYSYKTHSYMLEERNPSAN